MTDEDLVYDGRARKRPPGANTLTIEVYDLLDEHSQGLTFDELLNELRAGFPTDAYRAYEHRLVSGRKKKDESGQAQGGSVTTSLPAPRLLFGTPEFKLHAEHWYLSRTLRSMKNWGTVRQLDDGRWQRTGRPPTVWIVCEAGQRHAVPYDSKKGREEDAARVRRAHLREDARQVLGDKRLSAKARRVIEQLLEST